MIELIGNWLTNQPWMVIATAFVVCGSFGAGCAGAGYYMLWRLGGG
jgi:hypothetical protein